MTGLSAARRVADTVLYEGYLLYPYRSTSAKNQVRWQFGVLSPAGAAAAGLGEAPALSAVLLLRPAAGALLDVHVRFLHVQARVVEVPTGSGYEAVGRLRIGDTDWVAWSEAADREVVVPGISAAELLAGRTVGITVEAGESVEELADATGTPVGRLRRTRQPLAAELTLAATEVDGWLRLEVGLRNTATWDPAESTRDLAAGRALVGAHLLLVGDDLGFVALTDPPADAVRAAAAIRNAGWWPVLVGDTVLVAPMILPDQPEIAPQSPGDLFDATEIDEILTLRVMTLTEEEKAAARGTDPRAAAILARCDTLSPDALQSLHGILRTSGDGPGSAGLPGVGMPAAGATSAAAGMPGAAGMAGAAEVPWWDPGADASVSPETDSVLVDGVALARGSRVRLRPNRRADAQDMFLAGQDATVTAVLSDVDGGTHVAVVVTDDPGADLHDWYGRYWYFDPDELEPLPSGGTP